MLGTILRDRADHHFRFGECRVQVVHVPIWVARKITPAMAVRDAKWIA
ncbi:hypothetical protein [Sphingomonas sp. PR090111-T3T-6A]|nr:hypothetical protein [Sphingomonas sp. PR090111-T3T-6A]